MNKKERIETVIHHKVVDRIPWTIYRSLAPWGATELQCRNKHLSLCYQHFPIYKVIRPNVEVSEQVKYLVDEKRGKKIITRTFVTPVGEISSMQQFAVDSAVGPGDLIRRFGSEIDQEDISWMTKYPFERKSDYETLQYIITDTRYSPNYEEYEKTSRIIGSEGVIMARMGKSPFQSILYELLGPERCFFEIHDHPVQFQSLYELMFQKEREKYEIAADSPATIIWCADNITGTITSPHFFKEFCIPFYNEMAQLLHRKNKVLAVHMDGKLRALAHLIGQTKIDVIEAFTPPPMGDIPIHEARAIWKDKVIWCNFPETIIGTCNAKIIRDFTIQLLKSVVPGNNFILGLTENFLLDGWQVAFSVIADVLREFGSYPIRL